MKNELESELNTNLRRDADDLLFVTKAATIILPLPDREGYYVAIGTAEGVKRTLDSAREKVE